MTSGLLGGCTINRLKCLKAGFPHILGEWQSLTTIKVDRRINQMEVVIDL